MSYCFRFRSAVPGLCRIGLCRIAMAPAVLALVAVAVWSNAHAVRADSIPPEDFQTLEGLEVTLWATTPMFYNPTNMDVDHLGRIWVIEAVNYRMFKNKGKTDIDHYKQGDRVVWMQDTDGDGKADKSQVFVQDKDLVAPLGIGVIDNEIFVSSAPSIIRYTDVNRDGKFDPKVDKKAIWLTGFGGKDHDHSLHSVTVGPDGWFYFNAGNAGPHIVTDKSGWTLRSGSSYNGGAPSMGKNRPYLKSDDGRMWVGGVALRIKPDGTRMTPIGHNFRNSYEQTVTSFGDVFQNDNDDPPACRTTWLMEYANMGFASADGSRSWRADQRPGQSVPVAEWRQEDPGTTPAGDVYGNGAPTGIVYYENGAMGDKHRGMLLSCESAKRVVFGYYPKPDKSGFKLERFDFLIPKKGKGSWFRPADVAVGTDGAIYVADWYDPGVGGHAMKDRSASGSIYRIAPKGFKPGTPAINVADLGASTNAAIAALKSPAINVRYLGFRALAAQGDQAVPALSKLWNEERDRQVAARAVWLLAQSPKGVAIAKKIMTTHDDPQSRILAFRALRRAGQDVLALAKPLARHPSSAVRREVLLALRDVPFANKQQLLVTLASQYDGEDRWYLEAIGTAAENHEADLYALLHPKIGHKDSLQWDKRFTGIAWRLHPTAAVNDLFKRASTKALPLLDRRAMIDAIAFIKNRDAVQAMAKLANEGPEDLRSYATWWGHNRHSNDWRNYNLISLFPKQPPRVAGKSKKGNKPKKINMTRFKTLERKPAFVSKTVKGGTLIDIEVDITGAGTLTLLVDDAGDGINSDWANWIEPKLVGPDGEVSLTSLSWYAASAEWGSVNVNKNASGKPLSVAGKRYRQGIGTHAHAMIDYDLTGKNYTRFIAKAGIDSAKSKSPASVKFMVFTKKQGPAPILDKKKILAIKGDAARGKKLFSGKANCVQCHAAGGVGQSHGPDLTGIAKRFEKSLVVDNMLDPSASISLGYEAVQIDTELGESYIGFIVSDGDPVILKDIAGQQHTIDKSEIDTRKQLKQSLMPAVSTLGLNNRDIADIVAFLSETKP